MKASLKTLEDRSLEIGRQLARKVFEKRGNHTEAHLSEMELAAICSLAAQGGMHEVMLTVRTSPARDGATR